MSWYDDASDGIDRGVRVSFVDYSTPSAPTYRHVLLVEPYARSDGRASFRPVNLHAGGMFWYGHYLYVASTSAGLRVFDLRHLWQTATGNDAVIGLQADGSYQAYGYKYVLPQALTYTRSTTGGYANLTHSFVALDGKFYLSTSDGSANLGDLATLRPGGSVVMHTDALPIGPEDLSYWPARDQLWSLTEYAGSRPVFAVRASAY